MPGIRSAVHRQGGGPSTSSDLQKDLVRKEVALARSCVRQAATVHDKAAQLNAHHCEELPFTVIPKLCRAQELFSLHAKPAGCSVTEKLLSHAVSLATAKVHEASYTGTPSVSLARCCATCLRSSGSTDLISVRVVPLAADIVPAERPAAADAVFLCPTCKASGRRWQHKFEQHCGLDASPAGGDNVADGDGNDDDDEPPAGGDAGDGTVATDLRKFLAFQCLKAFMRRPAAPKLDLNVEADELRLHYALGRRLRQELIGWRWAPRRFYPLLSRSLTRRFFVLRMPEEDVGGGRAPQWGFSFWNDAIMVPTGVGGLLVAVPCDARPFEKSTQWVECTATSLDLSKLPPCTAVEFAKLVRQAKPSVAYLARQGGGAAGRQGDGDDDDFDGSVTVRNNIFNTYIDKEPTEQFVDNVAEKHKLEEKMAGRCATTAAQVKDLLGKVANPPHGTASTLTGSAQRALQQLDSAKEWRVASTHRVAGLRQVVVRPRRGAQKWVLGVRKVKPGASTPAALVDGRAFNGNTDIEVKLVLHSVEGSSID